MTTEELIEKYLQAVDEIDIAESNDEDADNWIIQMADAASDLVGRRVSADVWWQNGRVTQTEGTVISLAHEKVYLESAMGPVEGDAGTMQPA